MTAGLLQVLFVQLLNLGILMRTADLVANWNKRYQENLQRLKSGDLYEVAGVIKGLMYRDQVRGLSTGERKMLHNAKQIIISEIVLVEESDYRDVERRLDLAMGAKAAH